MQPREICLLMEPIIHPMPDPSATSHEFTAEVRQLLDIVINALYTDREIFLRELVSNANDALEKLSMVQLKENDIFQGDLEPKITVEADKEAKTITITDTGIGMTREELVENLGTIAHSGTKAFVESLSESERKDAGTIGQFGVGFYAAFMVADRVKVYTHSWRSDADGGEHLCWTSDGTGGYEITEEPGQTRGTRIVLELKDDADEYAEEIRLKGILKQYSSFVPFPVMMGEEQVNQVEALWLKDKKEITDEQYKEFYQFTAHAWDEPRYRLHFSSDAPITINTLLFVPAENPELPGMGQVEPGVALYCKKVLIDSKPEGLLPDWMRFLKGVLDSSDLPLNISRESMQDSNLVRKLGEVVGNRFVKFLKGEAKKGEEGGYDEFYARFGRYLKEGVVTDYPRKEDLAGLLRYESSMTEDGKTTGLQGYLDRAKDDQDSIYYQTASSRAAIESGPYLEAFAARGLEVLFLTDPADDVVAGALAEFDGKKLVAIDQADLDLGDSDSTPEGEALTDSDLEALCGWLGEHYGEGVKEVKGGSRLVSSPAAALASDEAMPPQMRQMMAAMGQQVPDAQPFILELNPRHPLVHRLAAVREANPDLAQLVADQLRDNAMLAAGLLEQPDQMVGRMYDLMEKALGEK